MAFGLSLYSVSWTLTVSITPPPEAVELEVEAALFWAPPPEPPQPPETAATTTTTAPSREYRCVLMAGLRDFWSGGFPRKWIATFPLNPSSRTGLKGGVPFGRRERFDLA